MRRKGASRKFRGARVPLHFLALMGSRLALGAPPSYLLAYQEAGFRYEYCEKSASSHSDVGKTLAASCAFRRSALVSGCTTGGPY